jgi:gliding motility-associated-like protein
MVVTLAPCNAWKFEYDPPCCRNIPLNISSGSMHVETIFNTLNFPENSSPDFADEVKPIPSACVGKPVLYGIGTWDADGDSLRFELTCAMEPGLGSNPASCVSYISGYSPSLPSPGLTMDSANGMISYTPSTVGRIVVAFWVKEYERCTGILKAQTLRDVQFRAEVCNNNIPRDISGISNIQGNKIVQLDTFTLQVCSGELISFEDTIYDPDLSDTLIFFSNSPVVLPGSQMTVIQLKQQLNKNMAVVRWTWRATVGLNPIKRFFVVFNDDQCDYPGNGFSVFEIQVLNSTYAGEDTALCRLDTLSISATGGKLYKWRSIYGDSLIYSGPNRNVWSDTTANDTNRTMKFYATKTTVLEVWSDLREGCMIAQACDVRDSIKVVIAPDYSLTSHNDTLICFNDSTIPLFTQPSLGGHVYKYKWTPSNPNSGWISNDSIANPLVTPVVNQTYYIRAESDSGCIRHDTLSVNLTPPFPDNIRATASDTFSCYGGRINLDLLLGYIPTSCGVSQGLCAGGAVSKLVGGDTTANAKGGSGTVSWPCPYGGMSTSARSQFLFRASELNAVGMSAGILKGLSFFVNEVAGSSTLSNYTIRIKCTSINTLTTWQMGTIQVFNPKTINIVQGWNYHAFDTDYDWDGVSNLIVDICYTGGGTTANNAVRYTATTYNSCLTYYAGTNTCNSTSLSLASNINRPNVNFNICLGPNPLIYDYTWYDGTLLNSDSIKSPIATTWDTVTYYAFVADTFGKCSGYSSKIFIDLSKIETGNDTVLCPYDTIQVTVTPQTVCKGPKTYRWRSTNGEWISDTTLQSPLIMATQNTMYVVTYRDTCGCEIKDTISVNMRSLPFPNIVKLPPSCGQSNGSITLQSAGGKSPFEYSLDSGITKNSNGLFPNLNNGYFNIWIRDAEGCIFAKKDTFTNTAPIVDSVHFNHLTCYKNRTGDIEVFASLGIGPLTYSINGGTGYQNPQRFDSLSAGNYSIVVRSSDGCFTKPIPLTLTEPNELLSALYFTEVTCNGDADAQAISIPRGGTLPYTWQWANGSNNDTVNGLSGGWDTLIVTDKNGCVFDSAFRILEFPKVVMDSVVWRDVSCYSYDDGNISLYTRGGKQALFYSITGGGVYSPFNTFANLEPKPYFIQVKDVNGCSVFDTISIKEPLEVRVFSNFDSTRICVSQCTEVFTNATGGNGNKYTYHWTPAIPGTQGYQKICPEQSATYWVYARDTAGCVSTRKEIKVNLYDSLHVDAPTQKSVCHGQGVELNTLASGGDGTGYFYQWTPIDGISDIGAANPIASPGDTLVYTVKLTDKCGSPAAYDSVVVYVLPLPDVAFTTDTHQACHPALITFINQSVPIGTNCRWKISDGSVSTGCDEAVYMFRQPGKYGAKLIVTSADGCTDSLEKEGILDIHRTPSAEFTFTPQKPTIVNPEVQFKDLSWPNIVVWDWNFAGLGLSEEQHPLFKFPGGDKGRYPVRLEVTSSNNCTDDTTMTIFVETAFGLYIPSAFTPNGDGLNDFFKPEGTGLDFSRYYMVVFNRWGELIFESEDFNHGWDGKSMRSGEFMPDGVYNYRIIVGDAYNEKDRHEYIGTVTLYGQSEKKN